MMWCPRRDLPYDYEIMRPLVQGEAVKIAPGHYRIVHTPGPVRTGKPGRPVTPLPEQTRPPE